MENELKKIESGIKELMAAVERQRNELNKSASVRRTKMSRDEKKVREQLFSCKTYLRFAKTSIENVRQSVQSIKENT
jgi:hypothetical protein|nr:MAG TPA: hypothetical protein [Caudoviricetes sp.]